MVEVWRGGKSLPCCGLNSASSHDVSRPKINHNRASGMIRNLISFLTEYLQRDCLEIDGKKWGVCPKPPLSVMNISSELNLIDMRKRGRGILYSSRLVREW